MSYFHNGCPASFLFYVAVAPVVGDRAPEAWGAEPVRELTVQQLTDGWDRDRLIILFDDDRNEVVIAGPSRDEVNAMLDELDAIGCIAVSVPHPVRLPDGSYIDVPRRYFFNPSEFEDARPLQNGDNAWYEYVASERPSEEFFPWSVCDLDNNDGTHVVDVDFATR